MLDNVFNRFPDMDISASIVWIPILDNDTFDAAIPTAKLLSDKRIQHYYDTNKTIGEIIAQSVGWTDKTAWDIYLFYSPNTQWSETPPTPAYWMHQLSDDWATKDKYRTGEDLKNELSDSMRRLSEI